MATAPNPLRHIAILSALAARQGWCMTCGELLALFPTPATSTPRKHLHSLLTDLRGRDVIEPLPAKRHHPAQQLKLTTMEAARHIVMTERGREVLLAHQPNARINRRSLSERLAYIPTGAHDTEHHKPQEATKNIPTAFPADLPQRSAQAMPHRQPPRPTAPTSGAYIRPGAEQHMQYPSLFAGTQRVQYTAHP